MHEGAEPSAETARSGGEATDRFGLAGAGRALLPFLALMVLSAMRQLNGALAARHLDGYGGIGVLDFPTIFSSSPVETVRRAVAAWHAAQPDPRFADGLELTHTILLLDGAFMVIYGVGLAVLILISGLDDLIIDATPDALSPAASNHPSRCATR